MISIFFCVNLIARQEALALSSFQENIDKKISKGRSVSKILDRRFTYELKRKKVDYPLLLWIASRIKKDKIESSNKLYFKNISKYLDRCFEEDEFSDCLAKSTRVLPFVVSTDSIFEKVAKKVINKNKTISSAEFSSLLGLFFYFPNIKNNRMLQYLATLYSNDSSLLDGKEYLRVFFEPQLIMDGEYLNKIEIKIIKTIYRLSIGVKEEVHTQCGEDLKWSGEKNFPIFSLCILNLAKSDKPEATKILMANKKLGQSDPWFQLMCKYLIKDCLLERELRALKKVAIKDSAFSFYLDIMYKDKNFKMNNQVQMGMAYLFFELKALQ